MEITYRCYRENNYFPYIKWDEKLCGLCRFNTDCVHYVCTLQLTREELDFCLITHMWRMWRTRICIIKCRNKNRNLHMRIMQSPQFYVSDTLITCSNYVLSIGKKTEKYKQK